MEPIKKLFRGKVFYEYGRKKSELDTLQDEFLRNISEEMWPHVKVKNKLGEIIVVEVTNNTVGHKIKMTSTSILKKLNINSSLNLKKIKIKIAVQNPTPKRTVNKISITSTSQMKKLSSEIAESPLKKYLKKIFEGK